MIAASKLLAVAGLMAVLHHGWADYDTERAFTLEGLVTKVQYINPHVLINVRPAEDTARTWLAVLAPPSRMTRRGLPEGAKGRPCVSTDTPTRRSRTRCGRSASRPASRRWSSAERRLAGGDRAERGRRGDA